MNSDHQDKIDHLWKLQEASQKQVQEIADYMGTLAANNVRLPTSRWQQLNQSWGNANQKMQEIGKALQKLHGLP